MTLGCVNKGILHQFRTIWAHEGCPHLLVYQCILDAVTSSGILKAKQKLGVTFNSDKLSSIDFTKVSKLSMCSAGAGRCWLVQWPVLPPRHCTVFQKAYILSGSGFYEFLYSIIESLKKIREIAEFIPCCIFTEKNFS